MTPIEDVRAWLEAAGFGRFADLFEANEIDGESLIELAEDHLKELGIPLGPRVKLLKAIATLRANERDEQESSAASQPPAATPIERPVEAERRQLTVMFMDLVGSTALSARLDPEDMRIVLGTFRDTVAAEVARFDGFVAQYLGDGILAYFGWPRAHEDDAERAVRAGIAAIATVGKLATPADQDLAARVGIATGVVVVGDLIGQQDSLQRAVIGETPNLAARMQTLAQPGQVVIAEATRRLLGLGFDLHDLGRQTVKGIAEPVRAFAVTGERMVESRFEASHRQRLVPLVGREAELDLLVDRWRQASAGEGQVVLFSGEPGIGKSHTAQALRERISEEPHLRLHYQCSPYHTSSALYPIITQLERAAFFESGDGNARKLDKLEALLEESGAPIAKVAALFAALLSISDDGRYPSLELTPQERKRRTLEALVEQLLALAAQRPVLLVLEDAHWIDPSTRELIDLTVGRILCAPVLMLITFRPEYAPPWSGQPHCTHLSLNRLGHKPMTELIARVCGGKALPEAVVEQIVAKTDGVPLFVEELTKTMLESGLLRDAGDRYELGDKLPAIAVPATLKDSLMARLDRLGPVREVAQLGACLGREFSYELVAELSALGERELGDALAQLVGNELLFARGGPPDSIYTFKHALIRDIAYESLLKIRRRELHRQIALALTGRFANVAEAEPEVVARHYSEAELGDEAARWWQRAGRRSAGQFAHAEAVVHFNAGLSALARLSEDARQLAYEVELLLELVASLRILGRYQEALDALDRAESLAVETRQSLDLAHVHYLRGNICFPLGDVERCRQAHGMALAFAEEAGSAEFQARALSGLADADYLQGRMIAAYENYNRCIEVCRANGFGEIEVANLPMRGWGHYYQNELRAGVEDCLAGADSAAADEKYRAEMLARSAACIFLWEMGDFEASRRQCDQASELVRRLGARNFEPFTLLTKALLLRTADARSSVRCARAAVDICHETGTAFVGPWALGVLAVVCGDERESERALEAGEELLSSKCVAHCHLWFYRHAMDASLEWGSWERAAHFASSLERYIAREPLPCCEFFVSRTRALAAQARDPSDPAARAAIEELRGQAQRNGFLTAKAALDEPRSLLRAARTSATQVNQLKPGAQQRKSITQEDGDTR
jgi:predicted ATPase/class 3 adenylate cyclase